MDKPEKAVLNGILQIHKRQYSCLNPNLQPPKKDPFDPAIVKEHLKKGVPLF